MKKKMQKYLSGSNEGFSLVELIIVIAIMAILIGVVALAVIPYLEKSRESKDLQTLSTLSSALSTAIADVKATGKGSFTVADGDSAKTIGNSTETSTGVNQKIVDSIATTMGEAVLDMSSGGADGQDIHFFYDTDTNTVAVYIKASNQPSSASGKTPPTVNGDPVQLCQYNDNQALMVSNGGSGSGAGAGGGGSTT